MKRKLMSSFIIVVLVALGLLGYEYFGNAEAERSVWGSAKSYETLKDIQAEADLVVRAHVPLHYDIREIGEGGRSTKQAFYEVAIAEVFADRTGQDIDEGAEIIVNQVVGVKEEETSDYTVHKGMRPMKTGEYLLFLRKVIHPADGKVYYESNSTRHLYKLRGNKTFKNISSEDLLEINSADLSGEK